MDETKRLNLEIVCRDIKTSRKLLEKALKKDEDGRILVEIRNLETEVAKLRKNL
mgnify:CR=1 FL=1|jgi:hypothetical protein